MADIKVFRVGVKLKELNPDATAVQEAAKRGLRMDLGESEFHDRKRVDKKASLYD